MVTPNIGFTPTSSFGGKQFVEGTKKSASLPEEVARQKWHCGIVVSAPSRDGTGCEFDSCYLPSYNQDIVLH